MFRLDKWYLDAVSDTGDVVILYWARLKWGPFRLFYGASLHGPQSEKPLHRHTFRPGAAPVVKDGVVEWSCRKLDVSGAWSSRLDGIACVLTDEQQGLIRWKCVHPSANARVRIGGDGIEGLGYVEHLTMTLKPWQLPFRELRWGRFLAPSVSLVWIQWRGSTPKTWVWLNGLERRHVKVSDNRVEIADGGIVLDLQNNAVIRSGFLNTTALRATRMLSALVPGWRSAHQTKWLAQGTLSLPDKTERGWAVHEVVRWP